MILGELGPSEIMCSLRAYDGHPTLVCNLRLKDTQRLGPDRRKIKYLTAPVASQSLGLQVVAISKKEIIIGSTMSAGNSRDDIDDYSSDSSFGRMESVHNSGAEVWSHPFQDAGLRAAMN